MNRKKGGVAFRYGSLIKALAACGLLAAAGVGYVWLQQQVHELGKQIKRSEVRLEELGRYNDQLARRLAVLQSPRYLDEQVKKLQLGLGLPNPSQVKFLPEPSTDTVLNHELVGQLAGVDSRQVIR